MKRRDFMFSTGLGLIGTVLGLTSIKKESETVQLFKDKGSILTGLEIRLNYIHQDREDYWEATSGYIELRTRIRYISGSFDLENCLPSYADMVKSAYDRNEEVRYIFGYKEAGSFFSGYGYITELTITANLDGTVTLSGKIESTGAVAQNRIA